MSTIDRNNNDDVLDVSEYLKVDSLDGANRQWEELLFFQRGLDLKMSSQCRRPVLPFADYVVDLETGGIAM
ncbi:hypothetical protein TKK_0018384 [Trichogramma kaykai]